MKLSEFRKRSNEYTAKASEITRQLSLAGIAIIWLFKNENTGSVETTTHLLDKYLLWPLFFLSVSLLLDLVQYLIGGIIWINFFRKEEDKLQNTSDDPDIKAPKKYNKPIYVVYYTKIVMMVLAYIFIICYLTDKL